MTREAKIGMLTGLGVIVLIGVLLSEYLGDSAGALGGPGTGVVATGRMAPLPVGAGYRHEVMQPVGVPAMARGNDEATLSGGTELSAPMMTGLGMLPPTAFAAEPAQSKMAGGGLGGGPVVTAPVSPVAIGPSPAETFVGAGTPPVIMMQDNSQMATGHMASAADGTAVTATKASGTSGATAGATSGAAATTGVTYTVAAGDTLAKIARKFYDSSKNSDVQRIVAANPGVLKDVNTTLVQGKKLTIPVVKKAAPPVMATTFKRLPPEVQQVTEPVMVYKPAELPKGDGAAVVHVAAAKAEASKTKVYVVQSGDTLEKIARKIAPSKSGEMVKKLIALNGIKDPTALQEGAKLKVPA